MAFVPFLFSLLVIFIVCFSKYFAGFLPQGFLFENFRVDFLKFYPPLMNFSIFCIFFSSLFANETIVQKIARKIEGNLTPKLLIYTKNVTIFWCVFLFVNFLISLTTVFLSNKIWAVYNGLISYILVGCAFILEFGVRIFLRKKRKI